MFFYLEKYDLLKFYTLYKKTFRLQAVHNELLC